MTVITQLYREGCTNQSFTGEGKETGYKGTVQYNMQDNKVHGTLGLSFSNIQYKSSCCNNSDYTKRKLSDTTLVIMILH